VDDNFPWSICEDLVDQLREGLSRGKGDRTDDSKTNVFDRNPVAEHFLVMCKTLGLVSVREVDRVRTGDIDKVGMQDVRKDCEAQLFERSAELAEDFDLFSHWMKRTTY
jgi:hypothetical protein